MFTYKKLALLAGLLAIPVLPVAAQGEGYICKQKTCTPAFKSGRMTGSGQVFNYRGFDRVQWHFRNSVCNATKLPDLQVTFGRNRFILTSYTSPLRCLDTPADEGKPKAGFDTITAQGTGRLNGSAGAGITFRFTDNGEPGTKDTASFTITRADGSVAIAVDDVAIQRSGNHQALKA